tara:strand:- start:876 stop:1838 length:963 start_codon:yes stop_codon:yes gene_type:complete
MEYNLTVEQQHENQRIDKYISDAVTECSRSQAKSLILSFVVSVNGVKEKSCSRKLKNNDKIHLIFEKPCTLLLPFHYKLNIVYEDKYLIIINKPPHLAVHPGVNQPNKTLVNALVTRFSELSTTNGDSQPGIVHRLDKNTSGLIIVAKDNDTHSKLKNQIIKREIKREYLALVHGVPIPKAGRILTRISPTRNDPTKMRVSWNSEDKIAITNYRILNSYEKGQFSIVKCDLETGRTHQIRVHMLYKGSPILGDKKYAAHSNFNRNTLSSALLADKIDCLRRHALHACRIEFTHPVTLKNIICESSLEDSLADILSLMKKD